MILVPVFIPDELCQLGALAQRCYDALRLAFADVCILPALREERAPALLIVLSCVLLRAIDIGLISLHDPLHTGQFHAAIVNAAVATRGDAEPGFQFEVLCSAAAPDDE